MRNCGASILHVAAMVLALAGGAEAAVPPLSPVLPGLGQHDPRRVTDPHAVPWGGVARLQIPGISRCTAALIGPRLALTAAHCLYGDRLGHFLPPASVHVLAGYAHGVYAHHSIAVALHIAPGYDPLHPGATRAADFALVTLAQPLVAQDQTLALDRQPVRNGDALMLGGYSQDRAEILTADTACHAIGHLILPGGPALLRHDCTGTRGTSGAPVLRRGADGEWVIAGLEVAASAGEAEGLAVPAEALLALIAAH
jgi:protease YdgD